MSITTAAALFYPQVERGGSAAASSSAPDSAETDNGEAVDEAERAFLDQWQAEHAAAAAAEDEEQAGAAGESGAPLATQHVEQLLLDVWDEEAEEPEGSDGEDELELTQAQAAAAAAAAQEDDTQEMADEDEPGGSETVPQPPLMPGRCPMCQVPLTAELLAAQHPSTCLASFTAPRRQCPHGAQCKATELAHFRSFSHAALALILANARRRQVDGAPASKKPHRAQSSPLDLGKSDSKLAGSLSATTPSLLSRSISSATRLVRQTTVSALFGWAVAPPEHQSVAGKGKATSSTASAAARGGGGAGLFKFSATATASSNQRGCPFYKRIADTPFAVDAFSYGRIPGCKAYFLTHFHSDHYGGLTRNFQGPIYCSSITARLVATYLHVPSSRIHVLPLNTSTVVEGIRVTFLDANHCPGAVLILFELPNGRRVLHTGDFRADATMWEHPALQPPQPLHVVHLDTTYCKELYSFPSQSAVLSYVANLALAKKRKCSRLLVVVGSYTIGKERVFSAVASALGSRIFAAPDKRKVLLALEDAELAEKLVDEPTAADVHVLGMGSLRLEALLDYVSQPALVGRYDVVLGLKPTGWSHNKSLPALAHIRPQRKGHVEVYGVPYSEHSSYTELKRFVQALRPQRIIPTVNVGSEKSRREMAMCFQRWLKDAGKK